MLLKAQCYWHFERTGSSSCYSILVTNQESKRLGDPWTYPTLTLSQVLITSCPPPHRDFVPTNLSFFSINFPLYNFPLSILILGEILPLTPTAPFENYPIFVSQFFSILPDFASLSPSLFLLYPRPHSVFNISQSGFSSCQPNKTTLVSHQTHPPCQSSSQPLIQLITSFLKLFLCLTSETQISPVVFFFVYCFFPTSLTVPFMCWIATPSLPQPILDSQPPNVWSSRPILGTTLSSLSPGDLMAFKTIYLFTTSRLCFQPSLPLCIPGLYL